MFISTFIHVLMMQDEWRMPLEQDEGPLAIVINPSRELARQTHTIVTQHLNALAEDGWPELRCLLCVGGEDMKSAGDMIRRGVHLAVCTPGRLKDFLAKRKMTLDICRYLCLDEADRMVRIQSAGYAYCMGSPSWEDFFCHECLPGRCPVSIVKISCALLRASMLRHASANVVNNAG